MTKMQNKVLSFVASSALVLQAVTPVFATTGDTVTVTGNGADSTNKVYVQTGSDTAVTQSNNAVVTNTVTTSSTTGGNTASKNTNGDVNVDTGNAGSQVNVTNTLNSNSATVDCCGSDALNVNVSGNGADSYNKVSVSDQNYGYAENSVSQNNGVLVAQENNAVVENAVSSTADTGYNKTYGNTGGDVSVMTGDSLSKVGVSTTANSNVATVGGGTGSTGATSLTIADNGADSYNKISADLGHDTLVAQDNSAYVTNLVSSNAYTGDNKAKYNTGGDVSVWTGDAASMVGVSNNLNRNVATVGCCDSGDLTLKITGNGYDSVNKIYADNGGSTEVVQGGDFGNAAFVTNAVSAYSDTGYNKAKYNTGGEVDILTGNSDVVVGVSNALNFNYASVDCCDESLTAKIDGNGADTYNKIMLSLGSDEGVWQDNLALVGNAVAGDGATGDNKAYGNTGDYLGDPSVTTGNSASVVTVANTGGVNEYNGTMPNYQFTFSVNIPWMQTFFPWMFMWH